MPPGLLYVATTPEPGLAPAQFAEWYNNEHGPARLRLAHVFANGLRYRSAGARQPGFLAVYDVADTALVAREPYSSLRARRSPREAAVLARVAVRRSLLDLVFATQPPVAAAEAPLCLAVRLTPGPPPERFRQWFAAEHVALLARVPGWRRSRLFAPSGAESDGGAGEYLALHDYAADSALAAAEHAAAMEALDRHVARKELHAWSLLYVLGPAPRDLGSLSSLPASAAFTSPDGRTATTPGPDAVVASYATAGDSLAIPYRLEGNPSPDAPTVAFSNSLLTSLHMWDALVAIVKRERPDLRILRYDSRGRHAVPQPPVAASLGTLAADLAALLDALRIAQLHALVGVSMGGATALRLALDQPARLRRLVACDCNAASTEANTQAWKDRLAVADADEGRGIRRLAEQTVDRWLHPASKARADLVARMTDMVAANDVDGFRHSCTALWDYDMRPGLARCAVPCLLVGQVDAKGAMAQAMEAFRAMVGANGAELKVLPNTGHLPMCEEPQAFWESIRDFLC